MARIGIYGGTFNPPHIGHLSAAEYAVDALCLEKLLLIPACIAPHKQLPENAPTPAQRLEMVRLAAGDDPRLTVSDIELQRGQVSYTYQTVEQLAARYPDDEPVLFMGTDMFLSFQNWRYPERIIKKASLAVFYRGDPNEQSLIAAQKALYEQQGATVYLVQNPVTDISSTDIRRMLIFRCASPFLHPTVEQYIRKNGLYGTGESYKNLSLEALQKVVVGLLNPNRVKHVLGCCETACELARIHGANETDAMRAALLHDITKALDGPAQLTLCSEYGISLNDFSCQNPKTLHALTGALVAERIFGENQNVVSAIESHTTGKKQMNTLEKIIYVADYMEPNRDFEGVEQLRALAYENLDEALKMGLNMTISLLKKQNREISPESVRALAWLEKKGS